MAICAYLVGGKHLCEVVHLRISLLGRALTSQELVSLEVFLYRFPRGITAHGLLAIALHGVHGGQRRSQETVLQETGALLESASRCPETWMEFELRRSFFLSLAHSLTQLTHSLTSLPCNSLHARQAGRRVLLG